PTDVGQRPHESEFRCEFVGAGVGLGGSVRALLGLMDQTQRLMDFREVDIFGQANQSRHCALRVPRGETNLRLEHMSKWRSVVERFEEEGHVFPPGVCELTAQSGFERSRNRSELAPAELSERGRKGWI